MFSKLVFGTHNRKKAIELEELVSHPNLEVQTLADYPRALDVEETGTTFADNAALKAIEQAVHLNEWVFAEDSGLCVDALKGSPGIFSARYSGDSATDDSNNTKLLQDLQSVPTEKRTAHYACHMVLADPQGTVRAESHGICRGRILTSPRGVNGFGYDPLFEVIELHQSFGELPPVVKRAISHRARAMRSMLPQLFALIGNPTE